jgi:DNA-binding MarR family transcriptional regulator
LHAGRPAWYQNRLAAKQTALKPGVLPGLLGYQLRVAQQSLFRDFAARVGELSPGRVGILLLIEANPGVTQSRLAAAVGLDRSTMVGVIHALEARGVVERRRGEDRRTNGLWLTRSGRIAVTRLKRRIAAHEENFAARLSAAERAELLSLLAKLAG